MEERREGGGGIHMKILCLGCLYQRRLTVDGKEMAAAVQFLVLTDTPGPLSLPIFPSLLPLQDTTNLAGG